MRGVPRERRAISSAPSASMATSSSLRRAVHDARELLGRVELQARHDPEAVAQRVGEHARAGRGAHQREGRQVELHRARAGALADHDVDLVVLERGIEDLLDHGREAVDLVDEEDVVGLEVGEDRGEVAGALEHRARGLLQVHAHLARDDVGERGLAEARRPEEQHVVERFLAVPRRGDEDLELLADLRLPHVFGELARAQRPFLALLHRRGGAPGDEAVGFDHRLSITSWRGASRPGGSHRSRRAPPAAASPPPAPRGHYSQGRAAH